MTTKLNDLQLILLSHAASTDDGSLLPLPQAVNDQDRAQKELKALLRRGLIAETETTNTAASWRQDGDIHFALTISGAGKGAIGLGEPVASSETAAADSTPPAAPAASREARPGSKIANVLTLLRRNEGATLAELTEATVWLPHTTRAALTGLKKKGHVITKAKRDDTTCYHITGGN